jgi:uncharacterized protein YciI
MKAVVFYERNSDATVEKVMEVYPRHKQLVDSFAKEGKVIAIGAFANQTDGSMGVFTDKVSAEDFINQDPFVKEGIVGKITIKEWNEILISTTKKEEIYV